MIKLIIKQSGFYVDIPGLKQVRTPVELDITNIDINIVILKLRQSGIVDYQIISDSIEHKQPVLQGQVIQKSVNEKQILSNIQLGQPQNQNVSNDINMLTKLLTDILKEHREKDQLTFELLKNVKTNNISFQQEPEITESITLNEDEEVFVPNVSVDNMKIKTSGDYKKDSISDGVNESVELLSTLKKKK